MATSRFYRVRFELRIFHWQPIFMTSIEGKKQFSKQPPKKTREREIRSWKIHSVKRGERERMFFDFKLNPVHSEQFSQYRQIIWKKWILMQRNGSSIWLMIEIKLQSLQRPTNKQKKNENTRQTAFDRIFEWENISTWTDNYFRFINNDVAKWWEQWRFDLKL